MKSLMMGSSIAVLSVLCSAAAAQESERQPSENEALQTQPAGLDTITVTARRRAESMQDTPISVSAVTSEGLDARGIDNVTQIGDFTPNVKFNSSVPVSASNATAAIFIRGIGQNDYQLSADPGVGLYLDGVYISRGVGNVLDVLNVERIEVLRGPQGTLFGRNTIGGAVNVVTQKPYDEFGGRLELTTGRYNRFQGKGTVNVPLAEGLFASLSGFYHRRDGYVKGLIPEAPDLGDTDTAAGRLAVRFEPTDNFTFDLTLDGTRSREESAPNVAIAIDESADAPTVWNGLFSGAPAICTDTMNPARLNDQRCYNSHWAPGPFQHGGTFATMFDLFNKFGSRPYQSASDIDIWGVSGTGEWRINDLLTAKSITSYRKVEGFWTRDSDHSPASLVQTNSDWTQDQFSQELQLLGEGFDGRLNWVLGGYYSDESGNHEDLVAIIDAVFLSGAVLEGQSIAGFAQVTYEIFDNLSLTAGARWTQDKKTFGNDNQFVVEAGFLEGAPLNPDGSGLMDGDPLMGPLGMRETIKDTAWTPMASLSYRWNPQFYTYASYSEGFKGGGFTQRVFPPFAFIPSFEPETSKTYEIGFKSDLFDQRVRVNGAVFLNKYGNLQVTVNDPTLGFAPIIQNAAKAEIKGFELEFESRPVSELHLQAGVGYLDAEYEEVDLRARSAGVTPDSQLQNAPEWTLSASASYDITLSNLGVVAPRVDWSYRSEVYNDAVNTPFLVQDGYHLLNAAVAFTDASERFVVTFGAKNITDEIYLVSGYTDDFAGMVEGVYGRPCEWYLSTRLNF